MPRTHFRDLPGQRERLHAVKLRIMLAEVELRQARLGLQEYLDDKRRHEQAQAMAETDEHPPLTGDTVF